ncbi:MAG: tetratricopeptide repeat protein [Candidatus Magnetominusculus sp. LBB02]|nr:tetratricopeptide repeat protein [Candidatus Magnetominusculus sp. LBB02]
MSPRGKNICIALLLAAIAFGVYWTVRDNSFVNIDDPQYVTENPFVKQGLTSKSVMWAMRTTFFFNWHPLAWLSHMTDVELFGLNPRGHHLTSLIIHIINTVLLFFLLNRLTLTAWQSAFVAVVFAVHPLAVESVAWVSERKNVLSTLFWFIGIWAYVGYRERPGSIRYTAVCLSLALGLAAKPMLVTFPITLLLLDFWPLNRFTAVEGGSNSSRGVMRLLIRAVIEKLPLFALSLASALVTYIVQVKSFAVAPLTELPLSRRLATAAISYVQYLRKMALPYDLAIPYPYPETLPALKISISVLLLVIVTIAAIRLRRSKPYVLFGWGFYLIVLLPVIRFVQTGRDAIADRYTYVPIIGISIIMAMAATDVMSGNRLRRYCLTIAAAIVVISLAAVTWVQIGYWQDSYTLFSHSIKTIKGNYMAYNNYAMAFFEDKQTDKAVEFLNKGLQIKPDSSELNYNMGEALTRQGKYDQAITYYARSSALMFFDGEAVLNKRYGIVSLKEKDYAGAVSYFRISLAAHPMDTEVLNNMGIALMGLGKPDEALEAFSRGVAVKPDSATLRFNKGLALKTAGRLQEAVAEFEEAARLNPASETVRKTLEAARGQVP